MTATNKTSKKIWAGRIISALLGLFMLLGGLSAVVMKPPPSVVESFRTFGYPERLIIPIGIIEAVCALIYMIPRTSVLGAVLITGYLGGAVATHIRINDPTFIVPVVTGVLIWLALYLRDDRLGALLSR
jgi:hypothetical protein